MVIWNQQKLIIWMNLNFTALNLFISILNIYIFHFFYSKLHRIQSRIHTISQTLSTCRIEMNALAWPYKIRSWRYSLDEILYFLNTSRATMWTKPFIRWFNFKVIGFCYTISSTHLAISVLFTLCLNNVPQLALQFIQFGRFSFLVAVFL